MTAGATRQAARLLSFISAQYGNRIISGQQESTWIDGPDYEMNYIHEHTGRYPAIRGLDICDEPGATDRAIAWWQAGGIPMFGYHMGAPTFSDDYDGSKQTVSIDKVLTAGTAENISFLERLDRAAAQLHKLRNAGTAAIWRPFHEAGGAWFWWSKEGGAQYRRLWRFTFDYMTKTKGVDNAVWLCGFNGEPAASASFYPGKHYADLAGADTYAGDGNYDPLKAMYDATAGVVGSAVPVALHENGPIPDPDQLQQADAHWVLFNTWNVEHLTVSNSVDHLAKVYHHDYVITRDEVPDLN
ncbi:glycosyl hydrolase [Streptomyces lancefieldiae]|uniref:Glycosyl hydrolase n=1 Tax=Streptomyces lancefieldiae TaxID=3075520 RepID=A0ABU3AQD3_9ACTN|nr:glycosyl hydrolase [Streptomyces sp. DSM 40712]MDT0612149.1 glycosyl hydrolase [Streptomyces sp. DSM 40712]